METPQEKLAYFFQRNGYLRLPNPERKQHDGYQIYKKGYEVRLQAEDEIELREIQNLLRQARFKIAKPFSKGGRRWVQPVYGREAVEAFCRFSNRRLEIGF